MSKRYEFHMADQPTRAKPYHLKGCGLPNVYLLNGIEIEQDAEYGELITIHDPQALSRAIGLAVITKRDVLTGVEIRYLRKQMKMTQSELAKYLRVSSQTIANYEKGQTKDGAADTAIRLVYASEVLADKASPTLFQEIARALASVVPRINISEKALRRISGAWLAEGMKVVA